ncbi:hypothetical protein OK18_00020 [Chryseobacterium gallinarum]|uniref:Uncharacterized protein n=1 Tax=Chryseobacterium gallinarum TaxID=1324352 RepID=A0A0G3M2K0_CHRGL|nr:hypothetical protein OK18_00020 [Chryseobacterium gallinarum]
MIPADCKECRACRPAWSLSKESLNGIDTFLVEIGNGSWEIADRVQYKAGAVSFPFIVRRERKIHKALKDAVRSIVRFSCNQRNILWSYRSLECLVVSEFISSCTIGQSRWQNTLFLLLRSEYDGDKDLPRQGLSCVPLEDSFADTGATLR